MSVTESDIPEVFFDDGWLTAVEYLVSSGKEGTVLLPRRPPHRPRPPRRQNPPRP